MNVETQRQNIVHRILEIQNSNLLTEIEALLNNEVYTYSTAGKPLSVKEYRAHLDQIMIVSDSVEKGYSTQEAKNKIIKNETCFLVRRNHCFYPKYIQLHCKR
jgi:hypothetical protein